ncbi:MULTISPECIES: hypothetical protein [unclassified Sphaerospermopsis]|jgi:hypothetical protein|uniref:hypothetical protein n=1 Tax=unclassified Sphaerospermopsis TaxID=2646443 RepID=UPI001680C8C5|nr:MULTISPECIES: hypothetical protein [unclassified Sphaerospermopsis]MBD2132075.1 hypothetical protein [Sphaerospermopsis sp. FACHB-1094]MBD2144527.1 hypothetical protein [Sphaerospermopsis sp. FACHB-1194]
MNKNTLDIQKQSHLRVNEGENDTNLRGIINNNDTSPVFGSPYDIVGIDGFNKGRFVGYWVGRKIRIYACNKLNLDCDNRSKIENE